eukprot:ANDGO_04084.mRNA.1 hypothetical protein AMSG_08035
MNDGLGVPPVVSLRIDNVPGLVVRTNDVTIVSEGKDVVVGPDRFGHVSSIVDASIDDAVVLDRLFRDPIRRFLDGYSVVCIHLNHSQSKSLFRVTSGIPLFSSVCQLILSRLQSSAASAAGIQVQLCELVDERWRDLVSTERVSMQDDADNQSYFIPASRVNLTVDVVGALQDTFSRSSPLESSPFAISVAVFETKGITPTSTCNKLVIVEVPSWERVVGDLHALRVTVGNLASQSAISLTRLLTATDWRDMSLIRSSSQLAQMMCFFLPISHVHCLLSVPSNITPSVGAKLLSITHGAAVSWKSFPIPITLVVAAALSLFRKDVKMFSNFSNASTSASSQEGADILNQQRMHELEGRLIKINLERSKLAEENDKILKRMEDFKGKLAKLVEEKNRLSTDLISAEEEKLQLSKSLIDLKMQAGNTTQAFEAEKYDLLTRMIELENSKTESIAKCRELEEEIQKCRRELTEKDDDFRALSMEFVIVKQNFQELANQKAPGKMPEKAPIAAEAPALLPPPSSSAVPDTSRENAPVNDERTAFLSTASSDGQQKVGSLVQDANVDNLYREIRLLRAQKSKILEQLEESKTSLARERSAWEATTLNAMCNSDLLSSPFGTPEVDILRALRNGFAEGYHRLRTLLQTMSGVPSLAEVVTNVPTASELYELIIRERTIFQNDARFNSFLPVEAAPKEEALRSDGEGREVDDLRQKMEVLSTDNRTLRSTIRALSQQIEDLSSAPAKPMQPDADAAMLQKLRDENSSLQNQVESAKKSSAAAEDEKNARIRTLDGEVRKLQDERSTLLQELDALRARKSRPPSAAKPDPRVAMQMEEDARTIHTLRDEISKLHEALDQASDADKRLQVVKKMSLDKTKALEKSSLEWKNRALLAEQQLEELQIMMKRQ